MPDPPVLRCWLGLSHVDVVLVGRDQRRGWDGLRARRSAARTEHLVRRRQVDDQVTVSAGSVSTAAERRCDQRHTSRDCIEREGVNVVVW
jgi:hypothetical protein